MNRGSEWRIWDLHVHTPASIVHNYHCKDNEDVWEKFITALENLPEDIKVLGINDYLFIDGYKKVVEYKESGRMPNIELILPVVEFRLSMFCGHSQFKRINFHVIFSNEIPADVIQSQFLNGLTTKYTLSPDCKVQWGGLITKDNIEELGKRIIESVPADQKGNFKSPLEEGFNNLNFNVDDIYSILDNAPQFFEGRYITAIGKTEWDELKWNDNTIADKKNIINKADIVFTAAESVEKYSNAKKKLRESGVNDLLLDCSDAHDFADSPSKDRLGNCFTWIKAVPTFEGLKQILYEPDERVRIQKTRPDEKSIYQVIDNIELNEDGFWNKTIYLNQNLNTIIGGRSTGKSTLLKVIAYKSGYKPINDYETFIGNHLPGVTINWKDSESGINRNIEFFPQNHMYKIASEKGETNKVIIDVLKGKKEYEKFESYKNTIEELSKSISGKVYSLFQARKEIDALDKKIKETGNKEGVERQIEILKSKIKELQKDSMLSEEKQTKFNEITKKIADNKDNLSKATKDIDILGAMLTISPFDNSFEERSGMSNLSFGTTQRDFVDIFRKFKQQAEDEWKSIVETKIKTISESKGKIQLDVDNLLKDEIYIQGIRCIEGNAILNDLFEKLKAEETRLTLINSLMADKERKEKRYKTLFDETITKNCQIFEEAENLSKVFDIAYEGVEIKAEWYYDEHTINDFFVARLNQRGLERQGFVKDLSENYVKNIKKYSSDVLDGLLKGSILLKGGYDALNVAQEFLSKNWFVINFQLIYQGDRFEAMSQGKQSFVILKLLLDFSDKKCPILIDQPEDNLDNRAIYNELVEYIKRKKKERQIILVTHNSNVVVSADSENVIVANQDGVKNHNRDSLKFDYVNGALEDLKNKDSKNEFILDCQGIREHVCDILEGGKDAFEKREQKYGFKR